MATIDFKRLETLSKTYDGVLQVKKTVVSLDDLPKTGVSVGDVYMVGEEDPTPYMWNGESFVPFGGVSKKYVDDQLNGYTDLVPVTGRKPTVGEALFLGIINSDRDNYIAIENPAGSGEKKIIIKYPVEDGRFDNTDRVVIWFSNVFDIIGGQSTIIEPISYNNNVANDRKSLFIPLNNIGKALLEGELGVKDDYAEIVIPDNSVFIFHTGGVMSMDPNDGSVELVQDSGNVVILAEGEVLSPVVRKDYLEGYTEQKQLPLREMTAEEKEHGLSAWTEWDGADTMFSTLMAYTNPAGSGTKHIHLKISTESGSYIDGYFVDAIYADTYERYDLNRLRYNQSDGVIDYDITLPDNVTLLIGPACYASEEDHEEDSNNYVPNAVYNIELTEEIEHGRVLREEDVATTKEAKLLGFISAENAMSYMKLINDPNHMIGFDEYTAYMQNYGPLSVYPATMASAETIDSKLRSKSEVTGEKNYVKSVPGYSFYVYTSSTSEADPPTFKFFPSLVCIGKTENKERWVVYSIGLRFGGLGEYDRSGFDLGNQESVVYLAVYDTKPKLTQIAATTAHWTIA